MADDKSVKLGHVLIYEVMVPPVTKVRGLRPVVRGLFWCDLLRVDFGLTELHPADADVVCGVWLKTVVLRATVSSGASYQILELHCCVGPKQVSSRRER